MMDITQSGNHALHTLMQAMKSAIGENSMMAYLAMMAIRLVEMHRVLKPTGSLYLHCDPTASHYLKLVLDAVFGPENFRNEIIWKRKAGRGETNNQAIRFGVSHDVIFFFAKSPRTPFQRQYRANSIEYIETKFTHVDDAGRRYRLDNLTSPSLRPNLKYEYKGYHPPEKGWAVSRETMERMEAEGRVHFPADKSKRLQRKRFLDELAGETVDTLWDDISPINSQAQERLGYPTQKPIALLERIIRASSNEGDTVLDPFCGCGTAIDAAQKLGRPWIGIDVTHLAIGLVEKRLREGYRGAAQWETIGVPKDLASAQKLAADDPHQFQAWITLRLGGWPWMGGKKGGDKGVDGYFYYVGEGGQTETGVISVKAGANVNPGMVRDLGRVMQRDGHKLGLFVTAALPTRGMEEEANSHGLVETEFGRFPALQCFTLAELFQDRSPKLPLLVSPNRRAPRVETRASHKAGAQGSLI
jgi:site-specific DNA-methyltransferase (adenine-specific)